jgi:outer membrane protein assembly factor BamB
MDEQSSSPPTLRVRLLPAALLAAIALGLLPANAARADDVCPGILQDDVCAEANPSCPAVAGPFGLVASEWPVFQHDLQHTGKSALAGPTCNRLIWTQRMRGKILSAPSIGAPPPGQSHGILYVPVYKYPICALNPATGAIYWCDTNEPGKLPDRSSPALGNGAKLFVGTRDNDLWSIDLPPVSATSANVTWRQKVCTDGDISTSPIVAPSGLIYFGSDSLNAGTLMAMCPGPTRQPKWCIKPVGGGIKNVSPAMNAAANELYVTYDGNSVVAFDPTTSAELWRIRLETRRRGARGENYTPVVNPTTGRIYVGLERGLWVVDTTIDPFTGKKTPFPSLLRGVGGSRITAPPALDLARSRIYFGAARGSKGVFYAIDLNGNLQWQKLVNATFRNTPPVVDTNGNVYFAARREIFAYTPSGTLLWKFDSKEPFSSAPILGNGRLYVGTDRGGVYAIGDCP